MGYFGSKVGNNWQRILSITAVAGYGGLALFLNRQGGFEELATPVRYFAYVVGIGLASCVLIWVQNPRPLRSRTLDAIGRNAGTWSYST